MAEKQSKKFMFTSIKRKYLFEKYKEIQDIGMMFPDDILSQFDLLNDFFV